LQRFGDDHLRHTDELGE
jgi:hypothetical protein